MTKKVSGIQKKTPLVRRGTRTSAVMKIINGQLHGIATLTAHQRRVISRVLRPILEEA